MAIAALWGCNQSGSLEDSLAPDPQLSQQPTVLGEGNSNADLPEDFPAEIPLYPNATLIQSQDNETVWVIADNVEQLETFYRDTLAAENWNIVATEPAELNYQQLVATKNNIELSIAIPTDSAPAAEESEQAVVGTTFVLSYQILDVQPQLDAVEPLEGNENPATTEENPAPSIPTNSSKKTPEQVRDLVALDVFKNGDFQSNEIISRRQFARWLFKAHNAIYGDRPNQQIRPANSTSSAAFQDVPSSDPDFRFIQGLAEAGIIPSKLTSATNASTFRPDAPLTRETLITWKVPLDRRQALPPTTLEQIAETWGFQDAAEIDSRALQALYVDFQNGDQANTRRIFGYTTLFQPTKPVTQAEAAIALWYFGFQSDGISAADISP
ncbi:S layer domain-containing protein [[Limnothrix rosea] IAM M-220]|nr:S layer domain-containing protein [[Limnothrix rosea] IAM M-220]